MKIALKILFAGILIYMVSMTTWVSLHKSILVSGDEFSWAHSPWAVATLFDAYFGFVTFYAWVFYKETSWLARIVWFVAIMGLGNIAMSSYVLDPVVQAAAGAAGIGHPVAESRVMRGFFHRRLVRPIVDLLTQGITPEKIALSIAFGLVLGVFPALGWTTLLCLLVAVWLKLNVPAMQLVNYLVYPLQLALLVPFIRAGEVLFRAPKLVISLPQILAMVRADVWHAITALWVATMHAIVAWTLIAPVAVYLIYKILSPILTRLAQVSGLAKPEGSAASVAEVC